MLDQNRKTCLITGARGYLGGELSVYLQASGWCVIGTSHSGSGDMVPFSLDGRLNPEVLQNVDALVHCAYDFGPSSWDAIHQRNVVGTQNLLREAKNAGIKKIITISSISAFEGCRSLYGKAKLEIEEATLAVGGVVLRPGLIYGGGNQGMYGRLAKQAEARRPVPLLVGSPCVQYLVHVEDLCRVIAALLPTEAPSPTKIWTVAHRRPWPLKGLLQAIAQAKGKTIRFVPVPWLGVWFALKCLETVGIKLGFKSDSVRSLAYQNQNPDLNGAEQAGVTLREFEPAHF